VGLSFYYLDYIATLHKSEKGGFKYGELDFRVKAHYAVPFFGVTLTTFLMLLHLAFSKYKKKTSKS
jgi:hypothetical protein